MVQALVSIFIESSLGDKRQTPTPPENSSTSRFATMKETVGSRKSPEGLQAAQHRSGLGRRQSGIDRLSDRQPTQHGRLQLREAEQSRDALRRQIAGEEPVLLPDSNIGDSSVSPKSMAVSIRKSAIWIPCSSATPSSTPMSSERADLSRIWRSKNARNRRPQEICRRQPRCFGQQQSGYQQLKVSLAEAGGQRRVASARVSEYENATSEPNPDEDPAATGNRIGPDEP